MARGTFLECLEPYILSDRLSSITPSVMKDLVDHYQQNGLLQNVEACIVHMDIATLDIHQVCIIASKIHAPPGIQMCNCSTCMPLLIGYIQSDRHLILTTVRKVGLGVLGKGGMVGGEVHEALL